MTKTEVQKLRAKLEAEYKRKLEAVALVEKLLSEPDIPEESSSRNGKALTLVPQALEDEEEDPATLIGRVESLFRADPDRRWTVNKIEKALVEQGYKFNSAKASTSIHTTIAKLKKREVIRVVKHGKGSSPSIYAGQRVEAV